MANKRINKKRARLERSQTARQEKRLRSIAADSGFADQVGFDPAAYRKGEYTPKSAPVEPPLPAGTPPTAPAGAPLPTGGGPPVTPKVDGSDVTDAYRAFLTGKEPVIDKYVDQAFTNGKFDTSAKGMREFLNSVGIEAKGARPIIVAKGGLRAPGLAIWQDDVFKLLNERMKAGASKQEMAATLKQAVGMFGPMYSGETGGAFAASLKSAVDKAQGSWLMSAGKKIGKGLLLGWGIEMLADPYIQQFLKEPAKKRRAEAAADATASEIVDDFDIQRLIEQQAVSALSRFPTASEGLLSRMGGAPGGGTGNRPEANSQVLPGEMYLPAGTPDEADAGY